MLKAIFVTTTVLAIGGSSFVYAQQRGLPDQRGGPELQQRQRPQGFQRGRLSAEDMRAFSEARIAALKAGLALTADQERSWPAFEQAVRELAKLRIERMTARRDQRGNPQDRTMNLADRLQRRATLMAQTADVLKHLADATGPLYNSLDDSQKRRFAILARIGIRTARLETRAERFGGRRGEDGGRFFRGNREGGRDGGGSFRGGRENGGQRPGFGSGFRRGEGGPNGFGPGFRRDEGSPNGFGPGFRRGENGPDGFGPPRQFGGDDGRADNGGEDL